MTRKRDLLFGRRQPLPGLDFAVPLRANGSIFWPEPEPSSPFWIEGPALISFSGGRTSALMLFMILWAHGGTLPENVFVCFANTGKEREETLRFVHECEVRFGVTIYWLEYRRGDGQRFERIGYNSASRQGEPFKALIRRKNMLPNPVMRFCTIELKIRVMRDFMLSLGFEKWTNAVGLRADEIRRIAKGQKRNDSGKERFISTWPLLKAGIIARDVWHFWLGPNVDPKKLSHPLPLGFDLGLWPYEGNCDGCFLKGRDILAYSERESPGLLDWWIEQEATERGVTIKAEMSQFRKDFSYAELKRVVASQDLLIPIDPAELEFDAECGVSGTDTRIRCGGRG